MAWKNPFAAKPTDVSKAKTDPSDIRPAPVDPTLEAAARETAARIHRTAQKINSLSLEITTMTDDLLSQFKARHDEKSHHD